MDKDNERRLFEAVYGKGDHWVVTSCESPDFLCERSGKVVLGVEVTQLWHHETDARLVNIDGYVSSLFDGGSFRHKDDPANLKVDKIQILPGGNREQAIEVPAIIREHPRPSDKVAALSNLAATKTMKGRTYAQACPVVDLVVHDASRLFWFSDFEEFYRPLSVFIRRAEFLSSPFREVFLLTTKGPSSTAVCVPLKANLLLEDVLILEELIETSGAFEDEHRAAAAMQVLFGGLRHLGRSSVCACIDGIHVGLYLGSHIYLWRGSEKVLRDYSRLPDQVPPCRSLEDATHGISDEDIGVSFAFAQKRPSYKACFPLLYEVQDGLQHVPAASAAGLSPW